MRGRAVKAGDYVSVTRYPRIGRPKIGDQRVTQYGTVVKSRGWFIIVEIDGRRVTVDRVHVRPASRDAESVA